MYGQHFLNKTNPPKLHAYKHDNELKHDMRSVFLAILHIEQDIFASDGTVIKLYSNKASSSCT